MSKDFKTLKMLSFFLALFIINKIWMHYQKRCFTLYPLMDHLNLDCKRERFKIFKVEPRSNRGRTVMTS